MPTPRRFRLPFRRARELRRDIDDELAHHLTEATDALIRAGMDPEAAARRAGARLGEASALRRALFRQDWLAEWEHRLMTALANLANDLGFAWRLARRHAGTALLIVITLALGIGVATTFAGAVDTILLRPLPLDEADRVMRLQRVGTDGERTDVAPGTVADWRERATRFAHVAGAEPYSLAYDDGTGPQSIGTWRVTAGYFDVLRTTPAAGRLLEARDYEDGADPVVVVSHAFWARRLGGDRAAVGSTLRLGTTPYRIVGALPPEFPHADGRELYVPRRLTGVWRQNRYAHYYPTFGLLAPGASREAAETELQEIAFATALEFPDSDAGLSAAVQPLGDALTAEVRPGLLLLLLAAALILVIAGVNAASLMLAEASRRARELAIRAALGAGRSRIVRQLVTEAGLLALVAGAIGIAVATAGLAAFRTYSPAGMPRLAELRLDPRLIVLGAVLSLVVAVLVAVPPALRVIAADLYPALKPGGRGGLQSPGASRLRSVLVTVQVALAVVLLAGGGLLLRSWMALTATDQGYAAAGVVGAEIHIWGLHPTQPARLAFVDQLVRRLQEAPGVRATTASSLPVTEAIGNDDAEVQLPGSTAIVKAFGLVAGADFFDLLGITVREGRGIDATIRPGGEPVVVVNRALAERLWPGGDAVGAMVQVSYGGPMSAARVIGVVDDVRYRSLEREPGATIYLPYTQAPTGSMFVVARAEAPAAGTERLLRAALREAAPTLPFDLVVRLEDQVWHAGKARRFSLLLLGAFGAASAVLTGIGLFGLMAHTIRTRTQELGIRVALGAWPARLRALVFRQAARLVAAGMLAGLGLFLMVSELMRGLVYGVATVDPVTLSAVALVVGVVALAATWAPARMATEVDPAAALRAE